MQVQRKHAGGPLMVVVAASALIAYVMLGPASDSSIHRALRLGEARVSAQPTGTVLGRASTVPLGRGGVTPAVSAPLTPPTAAALAAHRAELDAMARARAARDAMLPAVDPNVAPQVPLPALMADVRVVDAAGIASVGAPEPRADGAIAVMRATEIDPPAGFSASTGSPAVAQSGKFVFETWNWYAARSVNGGSTFAPIDPKTASPAMADFCCDQDVLYDPANDRFFWLRRGSGNVGTGGNFENRLVVSVSSDAFASTACFADLRGLGAFGLANTYLGNPRISLSNNFLYLTTDAYAFAGGVVGAFVTHIIARYDLNNFGDCVSFSGNVWTTTQGWGPTMVENARDTMYLGDHIITSTGLNSTFRVYWIFDDSLNALNFVDRTISAWQYTNGNAVCTVNGGWNPCANADHRIGGAVLQHNSPLPGNTGAAGDKIDFYWNVAQGGASATAYTESAGFQANTLAYIQRKAVRFANGTVFYAAVGANVRGHVGLSGFFFQPGLNPQMVFGIDDDFNGSSHVVPWEIWTNGTTNSDAPWAANAAGPTLRVRAHNPTGTAWVVTGTTRDLAGAEWRPTFAVWGRGRDLPAFNRYDPF